MQNILLKEQQNNLLAYSLSTGHLLTFHNLNKSQLNKLTQEILDFTDFATMRLSMLVKSELTITEKNGSLKSLLSLLSKRSTF